MRTINVFWKLAGAAVLFLAPCLASASVITNGDFETGDFTGWSASGDTFLDSGSGSHSGNFYVFTGTGTLTQNLITTAGDSYTLDFWIQLHGDDVSVKWNGTVIFTASPVLNSPYEHETITGLSATGSSTPLEFDFNQGGSEAGSLDDVNVTDLTSTPEPGTIFLPAGGFLVLAGVLRRRTKSSPKPQRQ